MYRNYFAEVGGETGQRQDRQLNNLADLQTALGDVGSCVVVRNGYTFSDAERLRRLNACLAELDHEWLMGHHRIGLQQRVEITFTTRFVEPTTATHVTQAFCSALSCGYTGGGQALWAPLASLVLDAAYEATLCAAVVDANEGDGTGTVWLTQLGGGAFGNELSWIGNASRRAVERMRNHDLDVRIAHHQRLRPEIVRLCPGTV